VSPWPFVIAAYAITGAGAAVLAAWSYFAMRRTERR